MTIANVKKKRKQLSVLLQQDQEALFVCVSESLNQTKKRDSSCSTEPKLHDSLIWPIRPKTQENVYILVLSLRHKTQVKN